MAVIKKTTMKNQQLDIIDFKNRRWLFLIIIPIIFIVFILTFSIYLLLVTSTEKIGFCLTFVFFLFEIRILIIIFSKFRYVSNGKLVFNEKSIFSIKSSDLFDLSWDNIKDIKFYYRGDRFWRIKIGRISIHRGRYRYNNLHWYLTKDTDEQIIDKIEINGKIKYVKIRNENEKKIFYHY